MTALSEEMQKELFAMNLISLQGRICKHGPSTNVLSMAREMGMDPREAAACRTSYLKDHVRIREAEVAAICGITAESDKEAALVEAWQKQEQEVLNLSRKDLAYLRKVQNGESRRDENGLTDEMIREAKNVPFSRFIEFTKNTAKCPFHTEKTGSLHLYPAKNGSESGYIYCFGCGEGWTIVDFVMKMHDLTFPQAIEFLVGDCFPDRNKPRPQQRPAPKNDPDTMAAINIGFEYYSETPEPERSESGLDYEAEVIDDTDREFVYE